MSTSVMKNSAVPSCLILGSAEVCLASYLFVLALFQNALIMGFMYFTVLISALIAVALYQFVTPPVPDSVAMEVLTNTTDPSKLLTYAHRGAGHDAPENTLAAFREAHKNGAGGVEFDMAFTKDNIAVLFHDDEVDRTTDGSGKIEEIMFDELRKLDAAAKHPFASRFHGEKIPTFDEGIEECLKLGLKIIIDVKSYDSKAVTVIQEMFQKNKQLYKVVVVSSFYANFIYQLRQADPNIVTGLAWRPRFLSYDQIVNGRPKYNSIFMMSLARIGDYVFDWAFHTWAWYITGVSTVLVHKDCLSHEYVRMWKSRGIQVLAWTVNLPVEKEYLSKALGISYITDTVR